MMQYELLFRRRGQVLAVLCRKVQPSFTPKATLTLLSLVTFIIGKCFTNKTIFNAPQSLNSPAFRKDLYEFLHAYNLLHMYWTKKCHH